MECAPRDKNSSLSHQKHALCCKKCSSQAAARSGAGIGIYNTAIDIRIKIHINKHVRLQLRGYF